MCERASAILKHCAKKVIIGFLKVIFSLDEFNIVGTNQFGHEKPIQKDHSYRRKQTPQIP